MIKAKPESEAESAAPTAIQPRPAPEVDRRAGPTVHLRPTPSAALSPGAAVQARAAAGLQQSVGNARLLRLAEPQRAAEEEEAQPSATAVQRQAEDEEEPAAAARVQRQAEEEEPVAARVQRQAEDEEEAQPAGVRRQAEDKEEAQPAGVQRQAEDEEPVAAAGVQRATEDEEEPVAARVQRQAEDEGEAQPAGVQRQAGDEEEAQPAGVQRQAEEGEEESTAPAAATGVQAKLTVGAPDDPQEREADAVANRVVAMPESAEQPPEEGEPAASQSTTEPAAAALRLRADGNKPRTVSPQLEDKMRTSAGDGEPLDGEVQSRMEGAIGADFSSVRLHTDSRAAQMSSELGAQAFTRGRDIYFNRDRYQPSTREGQHLLAHELAHTVQQGAARRKPIQRNSERVQAKGGIRGKIAGWARNVPGYTLLTFIIGYDPIAGEAVERTAMTLVGAVMGLVPGGNALFQNLKKSGALEKAFAWLKSEFAKLKLTWTDIKNLFSEAWKQVKWYRPISSWRRIKAVFTAPIRRIKAFLGAIGGKIKELIFAGAMALAGPFGKKVMGFIGKAGKALGSIFSNPIGFLKNLLGAVGAGFRQFGANIWTHLKAGIMGWIMGTLEGAGIELPKTWNLKGIIGLVLQILGITYQAIRKRLVKALGEKRVAWAEKAIEVVKVLVTEGIAGIWKMLLEKIGNLKDMVIDAIRNWVITKIVTAAISKLATMWNPVGAIVQAIITIYNFIKFLIERIKQIMAVVEAVADSIISIASGNTKAAANYIEKTLARTIPVVISFLASLLGLTGIPVFVKKLIGGLQETVGKGIDWLVGFVVKQAKKLWGKVKAGARKVKEGAATLKKKFLDWVKMKRPFKSTDGKDHEVLFKKKGKRPVLYIKSEPKTVLEALGERDDGAAALAYYNMEVVGAITALDTAEAAYADYTLPGTPAKNASQTEKDKYAQAKTANRRLRYARDKKALELRECLGTFAGMLANLTFPEGTVGVTRTVIPAPQLDKKRAKHVEARPLTYLPSTRGVGTAPTQKPKGTDHAAGAGWVRAHLLSEHLHGPGLKWNLTPASPTANRKMRTIEDEVKPLITPKRKDRLLYYVVDVSYDDTRANEVDRDFATTITMEWGTRKGDPEHKEAAAEKKRGGDTITQNPPDPDAAHPNLNEVSPNVMKGVRGGKGKSDEDWVPSGLATDIYDVRRNYHPAGRFENYEDVVFYLEEYYRGRLTKRGEQEPTTWPTKLKLDRFLSGGKAKLMKVLDTEATKKLDIR